MASLTEVLAHENVTIENIAAAIQQDIDERYEQVMQEHAEELKHIWETAGEPAYARYSQLLLHPAMKELTQAGLVCDPAFPGTFPLSREQWGPQEERERRFWCVLWKSDRSAALGALITCLFHDHTQLRIPQRPLVLPLVESSQMVIAMRVEQSAVPGMKQYE